MRPLRREIAISRGHFPIMSRLIAIAALACIAQLATPGGAVAQGIGTGFLDIPQYDQRSGGVVRNPGAIRQVPRGNSDFRIDGTITGPLGARNDSAHQAWCRNNHRSYDGLSDTIRREDGGRGRCRSPFE